MPKRDMRFKVNKQILGTAANRDTYIQRKSVVLRDSTKPSEKSSSEKKPEV